VDLYKYIFERKSEDVCFYSRSGCHSRSYIDEQLVRRVYVTFARVENRRPRPCRAIYSPSYDSVGRTFCYIKRMKNKVKNIPNNKTRLQAAHTVGRRLSFPRFPTDVCRHNCVDETARSSPSTGPGGQRTTTASRVFFLFRWRRTCF